MYFALIYIFNLQYARDLNFEVPPNPRRGRKSIYGSFFEISKSLILEILNARENEFEFYRGYIGIKNE